MDDFATRVWILIVYFPRCAYFRKKGNRNHLQNSIEQNDASETDYLLEIAFLKCLRVQKRVGSDKKGYWPVGG